MEGGDLCMSSIDERVVQMKFENAAFERGVQQTLDSLARLNKGLQLQGASKGLQGVTTVAQQFDKHITQNRDSLGRFTTSVQQSTSTTASFSQKLSESGGFLSKFSTGFSSLVSHVSNFVSKTDSGRNSLGQFTGGLSKVSGAADGSSSSLKRMEGAVSSIAGRFSALQQMATGALNNIGARAAQAGTQFFNSFSFGPIMQGFHEYETNLNSIQTILANTQSAGTNLKDVNGALNELNHYADQTIYNFSEMAKNIGTFTAAGVGLKESTAAIKGIANLAALSGSNSEQASGAMYQLSQAISAGRVSLEDWNSVVNAGMGGTVFQRALALNAEKIGTLDKGAVKLKGSMKNVTIEGKSFRESITAKPGQESWLTSKVLTQTLAQFTGDLSNAQLKAQGFNDAQIKAIQAQAKTAKEAATQVKTFSQLMDTTREAIGSGWTTTWQLIFGDFTEAKGLFTGVSNSISKLVNGSSNARNKMISDWKKFGGRDALIEGLGNSFKALGSVLKPIKDAFREMFPATTGKQLADMTKNFRDFTEKLKIGADTADKLKRTFAGVFAVFGIAVDVVKAVVRTIFDLVGVATKGSGGFLNFTAKIGDFLVALRNGIREGNGLTNFFKGLGTVLAIPIKLVQKFASFLGDMFKGTGGDAKDFEKSVAGISSKLDPLARLGDVVSTAWQKTLIVMKNVGDFFSTLGGKISSGLKSIGINLSTMFEGFDTKTLFAGLDTGLLAGLFVIVKKFLGTFGEGAGGIFEAISEGIGNLTSTFSTMQNTLKAATLLQIALAIGILSVSLSVLAKINPEDLTKAGAALTVLFAQLMGTLSVFQKFIGTAGFAKMPFVMGSLILLAGAILVLVQAVKQLSGLSWNDLSKGLTGLAVTMGLIVGALKFMPTPAGLISTGVGLIALAGAIKILASAVTDLSGLSWKELSKGIVGVGVLLGSLTLFTMFAKVNKGGVLQGAGIILLAAGIKILASAVADMSKMSWNEVAKGLVSLAGALAIITGALMLIPPTAPLAAAGVLGVALSLGMIGDALKDMAKLSWANIASSLTTMLGALAIITAALYVIPPTAPLAAAAVLIVALSLTQIAKVLSDFATYSWEEIAKAMVLLAGTMGIIAGAMYLMTGALPGAAATIVIAAALAILAPVLQQFGQMSLAEIGKSLLMLAGVFAVFGAAALLLAPVIPVMIGLGAAVALLGIGLLAAGGGMFLFATGLTALAAAGAAGTAAVVGIVSGLIGLIPKLMEQIGLGIVAFAKVIATAGPAITKAIQTVLNSLINAINQLAPKIINTLGRLMLMMLQAMLKYVPSMVDTGMKLITGVLNGIAKNASKLSTSAANVVVAFLNGIGKNLPRVIDAGVKLIISFVNGVANAIRNNSDAMNAAGRNLGSAIVEGMVSGIAGGISAVTGAAKKIASSALSAAKGVLGIHSPSKEFEKIGKFVNDGFRKGLDGNKSQVFKAFDDLRKMLSATTKSASDDVDRLQKKLKTLHGTSAIKKAKQELAQAKKEEAATKAANALVTKNLSGQKTELGKLADKYDKLTDKIKKAQDTYANAVKTRDDYNKSITEQYGDMAAPTAETTTSSYIDDLKKQVEDTKVYSNALQRLRKMGLNDETYKDLLAQGTSALPFVQDLLSKGKSSVTEINDLAKQLDTASAALGKTASTNLYQAAVDSAAGLVKGLQNQQKKIEQVMDKIADAMVKSIKKKLGIKSPARAFMEVGDYSAQGLIKGLDDMSGSVAKASEATGKTAIESLRKSMTGFSDLITPDFNLQPTITPVLDLSGVKKTASQIGSILPKQTVAVDSSYSKAKSISDALMSYQGNSSEESGSTPVKSLSFTQNNYSPKALSQAEIYRRTKNQISVAKGALESK
jgi:tape measure domain-containing protein